VPANERPVPLPPIALELLPRQRGQSMQAEHEVFHHGVLRQPGARQSATAAPRRIASSLEGRAAGTRRFAKQDRRYGACSTAVRHSSTVNVSGGRSVSACVSRCCASSPPPSRSPRVRPRRLPPTCDATTLSDARAAAARTCDCGTATSHKDYVKCVVGTVRTAMKAKTLTRECAAAVRKCAVKSTCGARAPPPAARRRPRARRSAASSATRRPARGRTAGPRA